MPISEGSFPTQRRRRLAAGALTASSWLVWALWAVCFAFVVAMLFDSAESLLDALF